MALDIISSENIEEKKGTYLLYGAPGKGKTTTVKFLTGKTLLLDVDRTSHVLKDVPNVDIIYIDNIDTWNDWGTTLTELVKNYRGKYENVVVDNITELERCILSSLGATGKNNGVPSQADYQYMQFKLVNSLRYLKTLDSRIFFLAWEELDLFQDFDGSQYSVVLPQINRKIRNNILGLCDVVGRLVVKEDGQRGYILSASNSTYAKNQLDDRTGCKQDELIINGTV